MKKFRFHSNIKVTKNTLRRTRLKFTKVTYAQMLRYEKSCSSISY